MSQKLITAAFALLVLVTSSCKKDEEPIVYASTIGVDYTALRPEGIEFNGNTNKILLGSTLDGVVLEMDETGNYSTLIDDALTSVIGIHIDESRNRLLVCNADVSTFAKAELGIYNLETGARIALVDLDDVNPGQDQYFANDAAVDADGNIYVTDSFNGTIYKVDANFNATVFYGPTSGAFLNGIERVGGNLLFADMQAGILYKIPLSDPSAVSEVTVDQAIGGIDGMVLNTKGNLVGVSVANRVVELTSSDDWATATVVNQVDLAVRASTITQVNETEYFVVEPQFNVNDHATISTYSLTKVTLP